MKDLITGRSSLMCTVTERERPLGTVTTSQRIILGNDWFNPFYHELHLNNPSFIQILTLILSNVH